MERFERSQNALTYRRAGETVRISAWGPNAVRIQAAGRPHLRDDLPGALLAAEPCGGAVVEITQDEGAILTNGLLRARFDTLGRLTFERSDTGTSILEEPLVNRTAMDTYPARYYHPTGPRTQRLRVEFSA